MDEFDDIDLGLDGYDSEADIDLLADLETPEGPSRSTTRASPTWTSWRPRRAWSRWGSRPSSGRRA